MKNKIDFKAEFNKQRATEIDITDPMNNLITNREPEPVKEHTATPAKKAPLFVPVSEPKRTKRVQLVMAPELYEKLKAAADSANVSVNEYLNQVCKELCN